MTCRRANKPSSDVKRAEVLRKQNGASELWPDDLVHSAHRVPRKGDVKTLQEHEQGAKCDWQALTDRTAERKPRILPEERAEAQHVLTRDRGEQRSGDKVFRKENLNEVQFALTRTIALA